MTQLLCGHAAAKWHRKDFLQIQFGFLWQKIGFLQYICLYLYQNKVTGAEEIKYCFKEIQLQPVRNPRQVTLRQPARREAGSWPIFFVKLFYTVETFYCLGQILHVSKECLQLWWPLCVSAKGCTFFLQLFTWLEDEHCTNTLSVNTVGMCAVKCSVMCAVQCSVMCAVPWDV